MRHAVFTIVQDEPFFFPLWHKYYRGHYSPNNMYVLYHPLPEEGDIGPEWLRVPVFKDTNLIRVYHDASFDHTWLRERVQQFAEFLLGSYDTVMFTEVDEIVTLHPGRVPKRDLMRWLDNWYLKGAPAARCNGYEVVHRIDHEPALDPAEVLPLGGHVLERRGWYYWSWLYSKVLIWRIPPHWDNGFHQPFSRVEGTTDQFMPVDVAADPELLLLHLHKVDWRIAVARWKRTSARNWNEADRYHPTAGAQNRFHDEEQLREWWYRNIDNPPARAADLAPMPREFKDIV